MRKIVCSLLLIVFTLSGCTSTNDTFEKDLLYQHSETIYSTGTSCEDETQIIYINNYERSLKYSTHFERDEVFYESKSLIYLTDISESIGSMIYIEALFNFENDTHIFYSENSTLTAGQCYSMEIEVEEKLLHSDIILHKSNQEYFESLDSTNSFTFFFSDNEINYLIYQKDLKYSISTFKFTTRDNYYLIDNFDLKLEAQSVSIEIEITGSNICFDYDNDSFCFIEK